MPVKRLIVLGIALLWIAVACGLIASKNRIASTGTKIILETVPVDPRDFLRGDYVSLRYKINTINLPEPGGEKKQFKSGKIVFVPLAAKDRFWEPQGITVTRPASGTTYLTGRVRYSYARRVEVSYGIENYFVPEGKGKELEQLMRPGRRSSVSVEVLVDKNGKGIIRELRVEPVNVSGENFPKPGISREVKPVFSPVLRTCGDGSCTETFSSCPSDCGYKAWPYQSDVQSCTDAAGKENPAAGEGAARWFVWNGCGNEKYYAVNTREPVIFNVSTDSCPSCVCQVPEFSVFELIDGQWFHKKDFSLPHTPGLNEKIFYVSSSPRIKIQSRGCFYLDVYTKSAVQDR